MVILCYNSWKLLMPSFIQWNSIFVALSRENVIFLPVSNYDFHHQLPFLSLSNFVILWNTVLLKSWYRVIWIIFGYWPFLRNGVFIRFNVALNWINSKEEKRSTYNWLKIKGNQLDLLLSSIHFTTRVVKKKWSRRRFLLLSISIDH